MAMLSRLVTVGLLPGRAAETQLPGLEIQLLDSDAGMSAGSSGGWGLQGSMSAKLKLPSAAC